MIEPRTLFPEEFVDHWIERAKMLEKEVDMLRKEIQLLTKKIQRLEGKSL